MEAQKSKSLQSEAVASQLVCFRLADEEFGITTTKVREIVRLPEITHIPRTTNFVLGIANLRGNVLPVIDGRLRFALPEATETEQTRVLVLDIKGELTGLVVDSVSEVMWISTESIENPPSITQGGVAGDFLGGVVKLDEGKRLILTIDPQTVIGKEKHSVKSSGKKEETIKSATTKGERKKEIAERQLVSFMLENEEYAFDIQTVEEILKLTEITQLPNTPSEFKGLISVRGALLPIMDLRAMLDLPPLEDTEQRILVVGQKGKSVGFLVDRVNEVVRAPLDLIEDAQDLTSATNDLESVVRLNDGKRLILILKAAALVDIEKVHEKITEELGTEELEEDNNMAATAAPETYKAAGTEEEQLVTFLVGEEEFGLRITQIQEINRLTEVTKVPNAPPFVAGITNLRGHVIPLVDLRLWFATESSETSNRSRIIIVDFNDTRTGFIVDQVNEVLRIPISNIVDTPGIVGQTSMDSEEKATFISGIGKVDKGKRMVLILDLEKLLTESAQQALADLQGGSKKASSTEKSKKPKTKTAKPAAKKPAKAKTKKTTKKMEG